jgi:two-component system response regulator HydG
MKADNNHLLLVDDDIAHRTMLKANLLAVNFIVHEVDDGDQVIGALAENPVDLILLDMKMARMDGIATLQALQAANSGVPVIVLTAFSSVETAVEAMRQGAFDYISKPVDLDELKLLISKALNFQRLTQENAQLKQRLQQFSFANIIGSSKIMQQMFATLTLVAPSDATVLIGGESGTGKELIANALHEHSPRKEKPFIKVNCAALHENLLESELFGHEKGAFTGALALRKGRFEQADGGTLFLDEIGDMSLPTQAKILRVLQEGDLERLGGNKTIKVDVRLVVATHKDLAAMVAEGHFRQDLFFRLSVVPLELPPLRERSEDIPDLAYHFLQRYADKNKKDIRMLQPQMLDILMRHSWPGNIREQLTVDELPIKLQPEQPQGTIAHTGLTLRAMERELIRSTLQAMAGNKSKTAKQLGIARQTLQNKLNEYKLE